MIKKELGVKKLSVLKRVLKWRQAKISNADNGKSSHMTSLPQHELSEGSENVNFFKNDKK